MRFVHMEVNNYKCVDQWIIQKVSTPVLQHQVVSPQPCIGKMIMVLAFKGDYESGWDTDFDGR